MSAKTILVAAVLALPTTAYAASGVVTLRVVDAAGVGAEIGTISYTDSRDGLVLEPALKGLPPGRHSVSIYGTADCRAGRNADGPIARGRQDPKHVEAPLVLLLSFPVPVLLHSLLHKARHDRASRFDDLPTLVVADDGTATLPIVAPRLRSRDLRDRGLVVHADDGRTACGAAERTIKKRWR